MAHVAQMLTQEPIYKSSSVFCFKPILISAHKLILLIYGDNILVVLVALSELPRVGRNWAAVEYPQEEKE